ncbi:MAG: response regulator [Deltaproteobacteria bacterium]|nr:response regulator [Deltaproteobacteria bacterium]
MRREKLLLVDDEVAILDICEKILVRDQYDVLTASSGEKAMEIMDKEMVDILVTDIKMPGMSGKKLLKEGKKKYPDMSAAIITGYADMKLAIETMHLGAQAFIIKPFSPSQLKDMLHALTEKKVLLKENLRLKTLMPLLESSRKMLEKIDCREICNLVMKELLEGLKADKAAILLREENEFQVMSGDGFEGEILEELVKNDHLLNKISDRKKQAPMRGDAVFKKQPALAGAKIIMTPIVHDKKTSGLLITLKDGDSDNFSEGELEFITILSNHLAASMDRALLYRKLEEALAEVKEAEKLKDIFLRNISHEFRTPLNIVISFAEIMLEGYRGGKKLSYEREKLEIIRNKGDELLALFEMLLDASGLEANTIKASLKPALLSSLISECYPSFKKKGEDKGLAVVFKSNRKKLQVVIDEALMNKVLSHVLNNAIKFTDKGKVEISADRVGSEVILKIQDTGVGIEQDKKEIIFTKFHQGDDSITRRFAGAGLGLYLAEKMLNLMEGTIEVESPPPGTGQGSLFTIRLPAPD